MLTQRNVSLFYEQFNNYKLYKDPFTDTPPKTCVVILRYRLNMFVILYDMLITTSHI